MIEVLREPPVFAWLVGSILLTGVWRFVAREIRL